MENCTTMVCQVGKSPIVSMRRLKGNIVDSKSPASCMEWTAFPARIKARKLVMIEDILKSFLIGIFLEYLNARIEKVKISKSANTKPSVIAFFPSAFV